MHYLRFEKLLTDIVLDAAAAIGQLYRLYQRTPLPPRRGPLQWRQLQPIADPASLADVLGTHWPNAVLSYELGDRRVRTRSTRVDYRPHLHQGAGHAYGSLDSPHQCEVCGSKRLLVTQETELWLTHVLVDVQCEACDDNRRLVMDQATHRRFQRCLRDEQARRNEHDIGSFRRELDSGQISPGSFSAGAPDDGMEGGI